jgi:hypothetical protein
MRVEFWNGTPDFFGGHPFGVVDFLPGGRAVVEPAEPRHAGWLQRVADRWRDDPKGSRGFINWLLKRAEDRIGLWARVVDEGEGDGTGPCRCVFCRGRWRPD